MKSNKELLTEVNKKLIYSTYLSKYYQFSLFLPTKWKRIFVIFFMIQKYLDSKENVLNRVN